MGRVPLRRQYNVGTRYFSGMLGSSFGGGFNQLNTGAGLGFSSSYYPRYDNLLVYETPSMGGLRAAIGYSSNINDLKDSQTGFATADNTRRSPPACATTTVRSMPSSPTTSSTRPTS